MVRYDSSLMLTEEKLGTLFKTLLKAKNKMNFKLANTISQVFINRDLEYYETLYLPIRYEEQVYDRIGNLPNISYSEYVPENKCIVLDTRKELIPHYTDLDKWTKL